MIRIFGDHLSLLQDQKSVYLIFFGLKLHQQLLDIGCLFFLKYAYSSVVEYFDVNSSEFVS